MPEWLITVISIAGSAVISTVIGFLVKRSLNKYFEKRDREQAERERQLSEAQKLLDEKKERDLESMIDRIVDAHTHPIDKDLGEIRDKLAKVADGTQDTLRDRILSSYYKCLEKGYRTEYDIDNVNHMNRDYLALNGNTFVAECMEKFKHIPTQKEYDILKQKEEEARKAEEAKKKPRKPRAKKQPLLENK